MTAISIQITRRPNCQSRAVAWKVNCNLHLHDLLTLDFLVSGAIIVQWQRYGIYIVLDLVSYLSVFSAKI